MDGLYDEIRVALHGIWLRRWLALAVAWSICLIGWLVVALIHNTYQSSARLLVDINQVLPDDRGANESQQRRQIDQIRQTLTSANNLEKVALATGIVAPGAPAGERLNAATGLQDDITVVATQDNIFEITAATSQGGKSDAENAKLATAVVAELIAIFRDQQAMGGRANTRQSLQFLDAQLATREKDLRAAEQARVAFETRNVGLLPGVGSASTRVETGRGEISQIESQLISARSALAAINGQLASTPAQIAGGGIGPVGGSVARQQLAAAQSDLGSMKARGLTDAHPDVIALKSQIETLRAQAAREGTGGSNSITNPAYSSLLSMRAEKQATVSALESRRGQVQGEIGAMMAQRIQEPEAAAEYDRLNRSYDVLKSAYDKLLAQREDARLRGDIETETDSIRIEVIDPPSQPRVPVSPNRPLLLIGVLLAGIAAGVGAAFAMGQVRTSYPTSARLERASGLPVIGSITETLTQPLLVERRRKLKWLAGGFAGLVGLFVVLMAIEFIQRGMVA